MPSRWFCVSPLLGRIFCQNIGPHASGHILPPPTTNNSISMSTLLRNLRIQQRIQLLPSKQKNPPHFLTSFPHISYLPRDQLRSLHPYLHPHSASTYNLLKAHFMPFHSASLLQKDIVKSMHICLLLPLDQRDKCPMFTENEQNVYARDCFWTRNLDMQPWRGLHSAPASLPAAPHSHTAHNHNMLRHSQGALTAQ